MSKRTKIGLIATGDELTQGDILNTNGQAMAQTLHELGFAIEQHSIVNDSEDNIIANLLFQLQHSDIVIVSGGLGPTSDDRTRFAIAEALNLELVFNENVWQTLCERLQKVNLNIDDSNRQQALFPQDAIILPNENGTAAACQINHDSKIIFMLPGPPHECLAIFQRYVVPTIKHYAMPQAMFNWLLLGASEGEIATKLDKALLDIDCHTGYRANSPYLEFKVFSDDQHNLNRAKQLVTPIVAPYFISQHKQTAKQQLMEKLREQKLLLNFDEKLLSQFMRTSLISSRTISSIVDKPSDETIIVSLSGLEEYWQNLPPPQETSIIVSLKQNDHISETKCSLRYRNDSVLSTAIEFASLAILKFSGNEEN